MKRRFELIYDPLTVPAADEHWLFVIKDNEYDKIYGFMETDAKELLSVVDIDGSGIDPVTEEVRPTHTVRHGDYVRLFPVNKLKRYPK